ncbi:hypothetical protein EJ05DRAFT_484402 [Pseudovirgaria hyperparasitica]|uniref:Uncharacterized protein n=1 Tax=Pseudovirgaria hyperparasitica TaxID=470096 RepID=A0A6A6W997_9PEZI|nr:uncharacterized protein EJ05DRAFT_484402 [Pseudovirgaria hyperparasitica]KAF2759448.1 hypothetical protein EJ05DRAFT_484402 [Pseudovirgaria hyperparasitica]
MPPPMSPASRSTSTPSLPLRQPEAPSSSARPAPTYSAVQIPLLTLPNSSSTSAAAAAVPVSRPIHAESTHGYLPGSGISPRTAAASGVASSVEGGSSGPKTHGSVPSAPQSADTAARNDSAVSTHGPTLQILAIQKGHVSSPGVESKVSGGGIGGSGRTVEPSEEFASMMQAISAVQGALSMVPVNKSGGLSSVARTVRSRAEVSVAGSRGGKAVSCAPSGACVESSQVKARSSELPVADTAVTPVWERTRPVYQGCESERDWIARTKLHRPDMFERVLQDAVARKKGEKKREAARTPYNHRLDLLAQPRPGGALPRLLSHSPSNELSDADTLRLLGRISDASGKGLRKFEMPDIRGVHPGPLRIILQGLRDASREEQAWNKKYCVQMAEGPTPWQERSDADLGFGALELSDLAIYAMDGMDLEVRIRALVPYLDGLRHANIMYEDEKWSCWRLTGRYLPSHPHSGGPRLDQCLRNTLLKSLAWPFCRELVAELEASSERWIFVLASLPEELVGAELVRVAEYFVRTNGPQYIRLSEAKRQLIEVRLLKEFSRERQTYPSLKKERLASRMKAGLMRE